MKKRKAVVTGITGQDGSYLAEHLLERDYEVRLPQNIDDTSDICPGFDSQEDIDSGCRGRVTILTYQRLKFKLYQIAAPITRELYFR